MKVTNNKIGPAAGKLDTGKTVKGEGGNALISNAQNNETQKAKGNAKVNVSADAQLRQKAETIARQTPVSVNESRVAELQKLIDQGKYKTDAKAIADKLVDAHLEIPD